MIRKTEQYDQVMALRKRGFGIAEIAKIADVSKSTVSLWLKDQSWSKAITQSNQKRAAKDNSKRISLLNKARSNQNQKLYTEAERSAVIEYKHYKKDPLFIAGLMLYVSEGDDTANHQIRFTSSQSASHRIFINFAKAYLGVPRETFRFWVLLYPDIDPVKALKYWSKQTGISVAQFHKYQVIQGRSQKRTLQFGVGNTIIGGTVLKRKLLKWIEIALKEL